MMSNFTEIVNGASDPQFAAQLLPLVYDELRALAAHKLAHEKPGQTLDATALVHEAFLKLVGSGDPPRWKDRIHFYAAAAESMRRILIDSARRKKSEKHGGARQRVCWDNNLEAKERPIEDVLAIDEALSQLAQVDEESARLVKLRFYAGLSVDEAADMMGMARASAYRTWNFAKAWLRTKLETE
jgi:RNA polymerase sigma factor (TIGR02999 family)